MNIIHEPIFIWLSQYAYQPWVIYPAITLLFLLCSFGLPLPEEVVIISVGILAYMAQHPTQFPPPPGVDHQIARIDIIEAAVITFLGVYLSDVLVYALGKKYGRRLMDFPLTKRLITPTAIEKIEKWIKKYGVLAAGFFRFTPGLRFPGFWTCGMGGLPLWKFLLVDGIAALISVPTQVILVANYGETILDFIKQVKVILFSLIIFGVFIYFLRRFMQSKKNGRQNLNNS